MKNGGVAQLARATGSYPVCHWFKSDRRYQRPILIDRSFLFFQKLSCKANCLLSLSHLSNYFTKPIHKKHPITQLADIIQA